MTLASHIDDSIRVENLTAAYDRQPVLDEVGVNVSAGGDGRDHRPERLRQVHAAQGDRPSAQS